MMMTMSFSLTLIRHGETGANKENVIQGQSDVPLSDVGLEQARLVAHRLQNQTFTHVFASDLSRAKQTAQMILDKNKLTKGPIVQESRLRERKFGDVEGKTFSELKHLAHRANQTLPTFTPSGAETVHQVRQRAILFFKELCQIIRNPEEKEDSSSQSSDKSSDNAHGIQESGTKRRRNSNNQSEEYEFEKSFVSKRERSNDVVCDKMKMKMKMKMEMEAQVTDALMTDEKTLLSKLDAQKMSSCSSSSSSKASSDENAQLCVYVPSCIASRKAKEIVANRKANEESLKVMEGDKNVNDALCNKEEDNIANVLVVSHGGLLKELIRHFVEDLECHFPGGKAQALRISPNTGISTFRVSFIDGCEMPKLVCLLLHNVDHLMNTDVNENEAI